MLFPFAEEDEQVSSNELAETEIPVQEEIVDKPPSFVSVFQRKEESALRESQEDIDFPGLGDDETVSKVIYLKNSCISL